MKACGFFGASGAGKTTLIEALIPELRARGLRVGYVKHAHHGFEIDVPGKDSFRGRAAGAFETVIAGPGRVAKVTEFDPAVGFTVHQLLDELVACDWALVEGFGAADLMRIEVIRPGLAWTPVYPDDPFVAAIVAPSRESLPEPTLREVFAPGAASALADYLLAHGERFERAGSR
jgi:molybdopterin-guanine dinucleotide biosynthesis protein B